MLLFEHIAAAVPFLPFKFHYRIKNKKEKRLGKA
jgi:hypothetical protein